MNKYIGKICPYCKSAFTEDDDIVVCSDCEMPHHKECWIENKGCTTFGCQGTIQGIEFEMDTEISSAPKYEVRDAVQEPKVEQPAFCSRCGAALEAGTSFCSKCGAQIQVIQQSAQGNYSKQIGEVTDKLSSELKSAMEEFKTNDYLDPELPYYIGSKQDYYMGEFQSLKSNHKYTSWNTFAFLIAPFWSLYRKMYIPGAIMLGLDLILTVIGGFFSMILGVVIAFGYGLIGNYIYMYDIEKRIDKGKNFQAVQKTEYIAKYGDVNASVPAVLAVIYTLISVIIIFS